MGNANKRIRVSNPVRQAGNISSEVKTVLRYCLLSVLLGSSATAQFYYFGRNKVQYTDFDWKVMRTEHFEIYFYQGMDTLARQGAYLAERSYGILQQRFNMSILHRIPLIFYSTHLHFQQTNTTPGFVSEGVGGFFEFVKGRVVIPYDGSADHFRHVIQHELVHVFMTSKVGRVTRDHRQNTDLSPPLWFTEGLAEYWSSTWDTQAEMVLRDAVLNNYVVPLSEMDRIYGSFLMYKEGQAILDFIAAKYGKEKVLLLMENFWKEKSFEGDFRVTLGNDYRQFDQEWLYFLKKKYYPAMKAEDLPSRVTRNVVDIGFNGKPAYYKVGDKNYIYFIGNHTGYTDLYRVDLDKKKAEPEVVVAGERSNEFEAFHLFQSRIDISKEGKLVFVTKSGENDVFHFYDVKEAKIVDTVRFSNLVMLGSPSWSPDGKRIVFSAVDKSGASDLYILNLSPRSLTRLTNDYYDDKDPSWSPDGSMIVFSSDRTSYGDAGKYNLFLFRLSDSSIEYLTLGNESYGSPAWSTDGKWLVFTSDKGISQNVWMMNMKDTLQTSQQRTTRQVTDFVTAAFDPTWGENDQLIFTAFENFSFQINKIDDAVALYDSSGTRETFDYTARGNQWVAKEIQSTEVFDTHPYTRRYSLDIAQSIVSTDPVFGTTGGAAVAMSDILGNDEYDFLIFNTAQTRDELLDSFNFAISRYSYGQRANSAYGIFRFAGNRYDLTDPDLFYYEQAFGGYCVLSYPLSKFNRIEAGLIVTNSDKDNYTTLLPRKALLMSNSISYVWDTSLWGPSGPVDGNRMKLELAYTTDVLYSNVDYYTVIADYRHYFRLSNRSALASRVNLWYNDGLEARRFFMGGSWDLRGWDLWSIRGKKIWIVSEELRFPFIDQLGVRFPIGGLSLGSIRSAVFADFGGAWDDQYTDTKGDVGFGFRWNLGGVLVLRYDIGKRIEDNMTRFQKGLFYQFFFGWDF
jgi:hypothetical protein